MSVPLDLGSLHRAGEQRDSAMGTLEKQLICPICLEVFTRPVVILPCQHNLCRKCANELYQPSLFQVGTGGRFRCPTCRHEVVLDRHGVYGLQRNLLVENIIDVYKQESASSRPLPKVVVPLTCPDHEGEKVNIYCITCNVPTCSLCKVFGAHVNCQVAPLSDVYQQQKGELNEGIESLVARNDRVQAAINDLEAICSSIEENSKVQKQALCEKFERLSTILEERRKVMMQHITYEQDEKTNRTRSLVRTYGERVDTNNKLVETALQTMEEPEMGTFVQNSKGLIQRVNTAAKVQVEKPIEPGYENMDHYRVNFNAEERVLHQLDFIKVEEEVEDTPEEPEEHETKPEPIPESEIESEPECETELEGESESPTHSLTQFQAETHHESETRHEPQGILSPVSPEAGSGYGSDPHAEVEEAGPGPDPGLEVKSGSREAKDTDQGDREEERGEAEGCSHPKMEELCKQDGISTQQALTFLFYFLALMVILQRVWGHIHYIICT